MTEEYKPLSLNKGKYFSLVDTDIFEKYNCFQWYKTSHNFVARRDFLFKKVVYLHRLIMSAPKGVFVDHINYDTLDNRKKNLRLTNKQGNSINTKLRKTNTSGYKGVYWDKQRKRWAVSITFNYKIIHLGRYKIIEDAAKKYDEAARKYFGQYARLNFPFENELKCK